MKRRCGSCLVRPEKVDDTDYKSVFLEKSNKSYRDTSTPVPLKCTHKIRQKRMHSVNYYAPASPNVHSQDTVSNQALVMINTVVWTGDAFWFPDPI